MGEKILSLAEHHDDASMNVEGHLVLGYNLAFLGNDPGVVCLSVSALFLWMQGFPDRALGLCWTSQRNVSFRFGGL